MREFRRAALIVALANLAFFGIEFAVAIAIGSVSLFADSIDFLEDTAVNGLIVKSITRLTPDEVAALPPAYRP